MKPINVIGIVTVLCLMSGATVRAQFSSGSTGVDGPLNVTTSTNLNLPPDGKFNFTTISIASGATLTFTKNALNTPVYLLATGDVAINGIIDVSGKAATFGNGGAGGPGGFDGGKPANGQGELPGDGMGPGAGKASPNPVGGGAYGTQPGGSGNSQHGQVYGNNLIVPLIGGSGAGGLVHSSGLGGGGGGGGAILLASSTKVAIGSTGRVLSQGEPSAIGGGNNGSGGAVRIIAPEVRGTGGINVTSGNGSGGSGRIRVDAVTRFALFLSYAGPYSIGKYMRVFPELPSRLDIIEAAGTAIVEGNPGPVPVQLPLGSSSNQVVKVQARDFTGVVPITVAVTPDAGPGVRYDAQIDMAGGTVAETSVAVVIPVGTSCQIHAWTR